MTSTAVCVTDRLRQSALRVRNRLALNLLSEGLATFLLLFIGSSIVAQHTLADGKLNNYMQVCLGWGLTIALLVFATYHTSGGHMNPAVPFAFLSLGKLPLTHFVLYAIVQTIGAFFGAALSYYIYRDMLNHFDAGKRTVFGEKGTGTIFCSFPAPHISNYTAFVDQIVGTALLLFFIVVFIDPRNKVPKCLHPIGFGFAIFAITSSFGMNVGAPINPARDFGPRILVFAAYGWEAISWNDYYFWIPIVAPFVGALLGVWLYQLFIGIHVPDEAERPKGNGLKHEVAEEEEYDPLNSVVP